MSEIYDKQAVYKLLDDKGIKYDKMEHQAVFTMEEMNAAGISAKGTVCKNLFLRDAKGKNHYLVTASEDKKVDMKKLAEQIGSTKLSFASEERLQKYLGVTHGSVSPLCILNDESRSVTVIFDADLQHNSAVGVHPNDNTATVWLDFGALKKIIEEHGNDVLMIKFPRQ